MRPVFVAPEGGPGPLGGTPSRGGYKERVSEMSPMWKKLPAPRMGSGFIVTDIFRPFSGILGHF